MKYYCGMSRLANAQEVGGAFIYLFADAASYPTGITIFLVGILGAYQSNAIAEELGSEPVTVLARALIWPLALPSPSLADTSIGTYALHFQCLDKDGSANDR